LLIVLTKERSTVTTYPPVVRRPQFTIRGVLAATLIAALACGWYVSARRESAAPSAGSIESGDSAFQRASFINGRMRGTVLRGDVSTFQLATFDGADLAGAKLTGSGAAFQHATFARCDLSGAGLAGSYSSFQGATFAGCDLTGAVLIADHTAFQGASFAGAKLIGSKLSGGGQSFQAVNIDGTQFQGADLSQLDTDSLAGCSFKDPPIYDDKTRFPAGFDPAAHDWQRAASRPQLPTEQ
jgi:uncharacterized protein YjbI with pentapeptide repeats